MVVIEKVGGKKFKKGKKSILNYPAMTSGRIRYTYISKAAAEAAKKELPYFQRNRASIKVGR